MVESMFGPVNAPDPDCHYNAHLNYDEPLPAPDGVMLVLGSASGQWSIYAEGYKALADAGVEHAKRWDMDIVVYPIIFCYRQYLELRLKELIVTAGALLDQNLVRP